MKWDNVQLFNDKKSWILVLYQQIKVRRKIWTIGINIEIYMIHQQCASYVHE